MTYVLVKDNQIKATGNLPDTWNDGTRDWDLRDPTINKELLGWYNVVDTQPPADTQTTTFYPVFKIVNGAPVKTWEERAFTSAELESLRLRRNEFQLRVNSKAQIDALLASITTLNAIVARTNAEINANPAVAIKDLAREVLTIARRTTRIARLTLNVVDSTNTGE